MDIFEGRAARPMLIFGDSEPFDSDDYQYELKMDGERCLAYLDKGMVELVNRRGRHPLSQFPEFADLHRQAKKRCIVDGEIIVGGGGKAEFELVKRRALTRDPRTVKRLAVEHPGTFVALDILYAGKEQITRLPLTERQRILRENIIEGGGMAVVRSVDGHGIEFFRLVREKGLEGAIAKRKDSVYRMGRRTRDWTKFKNWVESDFVICGYVPSERSSVVSLILGQYEDSGELVYKGRVVLGANRREFDAVRGVRPAPGHPFREEPPDGCAGAIWLAPQLVCRAGFMCWTTNRRLRQPFFKELQPGKDPRTAREPAGDAMACC